MEDKNAKDLVLRESINCAVRTESIFKLYAYRVVSPEEFITEMLTYADSLKKVFEEQKKLQSSKELTESTNEKS